MAGGPASSSSHPHQPDRPRRRSNRRSNRRGPPDQGSTATQSVTLVGLSSVAEQHRQQSSRRDKQQSSSGATKATAATAETERTVSSEEPLPEMAAGRGRGNRGGRDPEGSHGALVSYAPDGGRSRSRPRQPPPEDHPGSSSSSSFMQYLVADDGNDDANDESDGASSHSSRSRSRSPRRRKKARPSRGKGRRQSAPDGPPPKEAGWGRRSLSRPRAFSRPKSRSKGRSGDRGEGGREAKKHFGNSFMKGVGRRLGRKGKKDGRGKGERGREMMEDGGLDGSARSSASSGSRPESDVDARSESPPSVRDRRNGSRGRPHGRGDGGGPRRRRSPSFDSRGSSRSPPPMPYRRHSSPFGRRSMSPEGRPRVGRRPSLDSSGGSPRRSRSPPRRPSSRGPGGPPPSRGPSSGRPVPRDRPTSRGGRPMRSPPRSSSRGRPPSTGRPRTPPAEDARSYALVVRERTPSRERRHGPGGRRGRPGPGNFHPGRTGPRRHDSFSPPRSRSPPRRRSRSPRGPQRAPPRGRSWSASRPRSAPRSPRSRSPPQIWIQCQHEEPEVSSLMTFEDWSLPPRPRGVVPPGEVRGGGPPGSMPCMDRRPRRGHSNSLERRPESRGGRRSPSRPMGSRRSSSFDRSPMQRWGNSMERTQPPSSPRDQSLDRSAPAPSGRDRGQRQEWSDLNAQTRSKASNLSMLSRHVSSASCSRSASACRSRRSSAKDGGVASAKKTPVDLTNVALALQIIEETSGKKLPRVGSYKSLQDRSKSPSPRAAGAMAPGQPPPRPSATPSTNSSAFAKLTRGADTATTNTSAREGRRAMDVSVVTPLDGGTFSRRRARSVGPSSSFRESRRANDARRARSPGTHLINNNGSSRLDRSASGLDRKSPSGPAARRDTYRDRMQSASPVQSKSPNSPMLDNSSHSLNASGRPPSRMSRASDGVSAISNVPDPIRAASPPQERYRRPQRHQPRQPAPPSQQYEAPTKQPTVGDDWRQYQVSNNRSTERRKSSQQPDEPAQQIMVPQPQLHPSTDLREQSGKNQEPDWKKYSVGEQRGAGRRSSERKSKMFGRDRSKGGMLTEREKLRSVKLMPFTDQFGDFGTYTGQVNEEGRPDGKGSMKYENGIFYEGTWTDGRQDKNAAANYERIRGGFTSWSGKGKQASKSGMVLPWNARKNDAPEIGGKTSVRGMDWADLNGDSGRYTGEVNNDRLPHGRGIMKYSYGLIAEGDWVNGVLKEGPQDRMISAVSGGMSVGAGMSVGPGMSVGAGMSVGGGAMSVGPGMSVGTGPGLSVGPMSVRGHPAMPIMMPGVAPMPMPVQMGFNPMMGAPSNAAQHAMISQQNALMRNMHGGGGGGSVYGGAGSVYGGQPVAGPMPPPMMPLPPPLQVMHPGPPQGSPQKSNKPPVSEIKIGQ